MPKREIKIARFLLIFMLISTWLFSGWEGFWKNPSVHIIPRVKNAEAAYTGKHLRTVEYVLGGSSDNTLRTTNVRVYAGSSWNTTKSTAGFKNVVIEGSGIEVRHAFLDTYAIVATAADVTSVTTTIDVEGSLNPGIDVMVGEENSVITQDTSGLSAYIRRVHDVTALFGPQTDSQFNAGLDVVASFSLVGPSFALSTVKLVITYEQTYSVAAHTETKTVRFPLDSASTTDTGTKQAQAAASQAFGFSYMADIPDATADADILDVFFELTGEVDSATAQTFQPIIRGGTAGPAFNWQDALTDQTYVNAIFRPTVGGSDFLRNATQTLDIIVGTVAMNALGGELVVTYRFSTGASSQTETVKYFMDQDTAAPGTATSTFNWPIRISNTGFSMRNIWFKVHAAPVAALTHVISGTVGAATANSKGYVLTGTNPRAGDTATIIHDLSGDRTSFNAATTTVSGATAFSVASGSPHSVELYATFTWTGSSGGLVTKTVMFSAAQQGTDTAAAQWNNRPIYITLPETVSKEYRSAYVEAQVSHSQATSITIGTLRIGVNASTTDYAETADATSEDYSVTLFHQVSSSTFSGGSTISWTERTFVINESNSMADEVSFSNIFTVTYDAALASAGGNNAPTVAGVVLKMQNNSTPIVLTENTTVAVVVVGTGTDADGGADMTSATATIYLTGVSGAEACAASDINCYPIISGNCALGTVSGNDRPVTCTTGLWFLAERTDDDTATWTGFLSVKDAAGATGTGTDIEEVNTLQALDVTANISYGSMSPTVTTAAASALTMQITTTGNEAIDVTVQGTNDMCDTADCLSNEIRVCQQQYTTNTATEYEDAGDSFAEEIEFSSTTARNLSLESVTPTTHGGDTSDEADNVYWKIGIPTGQVATTYNGTTTITSKANSNTTDDVNEALCN